jgi:hypothetical protein
MNTKPRILAEITFGNRDTRDAHRLEVQQARREARARGARYVVSPRHCLPTDRGLLNAGTEVSESDFEGFSAPYPGEERGIPLRPDQALERAVACGVCIDARRRRLAFQPNGVARAPRAICRDA